MTWLFWYGFGIVTGILGTLGLCWLLGKAMDYARQEAREESR